MVPQSGGRRTPVPRLKEPSVREPDAAYCVQATKMSRYYMLQPQNGRTRAIVGGEATGLLAPLTWVIGQVLSKEIVQDLRVKIEG